MYFYEVWVSSSRYHGNKPLTYHCDEKLSPGTVVVVPLQKQTVPGIIDKMVKKPSFKTQPIVRTVSLTTLPSTSLQLFEWLSSVYPAPSGSLIQLFLPSSLLTINKPSKVEPLEDRIVKLPPLTEDQSRAIDGITRAKSGEPVLLHGDTGTGKTRVYIELTIQQLRQGNSVLILTPEIGLTPQLVRMFEDVFGKQVVSIHSNLTPAKRRDTWLRILESPEPLVVIGPRSALFAPIQKLGLIVVDEAHDGAYKQEQLPYYQSSWVAARLAKLHNARLVLGTATPLVTDYFTFQAKNLPIIRLTQPAIKDTHAKLVTKVIELQDQSKFSKSRWLSDILLSELSRAIGQGNQSLLFLNRRGTARVILCQQCGWQLLCPNCDLPLTYHADYHQARCHTCGFTTVPPAECPICSGTEIVFKSIGTKLIVSEIERLLPNARVQRFDSDNLKAERLEQHYESVKDGKVDIIVGTQLLTKGLDLPRMGLVGVILADTSLYIPDYTAEERTFQILNQVIGRVGRGHLAGTVVVQSYHPDNTSINAALKKDYSTFYATELLERKAFMFPPYCYLLKLTCARASRSAAKTASDKLYRDIRTNFRGIAIIGPSPTFYEKQRGKYNWQIVVKAKRRRILLDIIAGLPANWSYDIDPTNLL